MVKQDESNNVLPVKQKHWFKPMLLLLVLFVIVFTITVVFVDRHKATKATDPLADLTAGSSAQSSVGSLPAVNRSVNPQLETTDDPSLGPANAKVVVVAFIDYQCPYCLEIFPTFRELAVTYSNRVRFIIRDFPVTQLHPEAQTAAEAATCIYDIGGNDKFWLYHDKLFQNQNALSVQTYKTLATQVGVEEGDFTKCLESGSKKVEVDKDFLDGVSLNVTGTPTFFFNGYRVQGVIAKEKFAKVLDLLLAE